MQNFVTFALQSVLSQPAMVGHKAPTPMCGGNHEETPQMLGVGSHKAPTVVGESDANEVKPKR